MNLLFKNPSSSPFFQSEAGRGLLTAAILRLLYKGFGSPDVKSFSNAK